MLSLYSVNDKTVQKISLDYLEGYPFIATQSFLGINGNELVELKQEVQGVLQNSP